MPASSVRSTPGTCCRASQLWAAPSRSPQRAAVPLALRQEGWGLTPRGAVVFLGGFVPCRKAGVHLHTSGLAAPSPSCPVRSHTCWPCLQTSPCPPAWSWQADPPRVSTTKWPLKRSSCPVNPPPCPLPVLQAASYRGCDRPGRMGAPGRVPNPPGHASTWPLGPPPALLCPHLATSPCPGGSQGAGWEARWSGKWGCPGLRLPAPHLLEVPSGWEACGKEIRLPLALGGRRNFSPFPAGHERGLYGCPAPQCLHAAAAPLLQL